jgi:hypothetical protein
MVDSTIIAASSQKSTAVKFVYVDTDGLELAFEFGKEDALEGKQPEGSVIYVVGGPYCQQYNDGYQIGTLMRLWFSSPALDDVGRDHHWQGVDYESPSV